MLGKAVLYSHFIKYLSQMSIFVASHFFASFHPKADVANELLSGTYFHAVLDEEAWALVFIDLHEVEIISESYIACFSDVLPQSL